VRVCGRDSVRANPDSGVAIGGENAGIRLIDTSTQRYASIPRVTFALSMTPPHTTTAHPDRTPRGMTSGMRRAESPRRAGAAPHAVGRAARRR